MFWLRGMRPSEEVEIIMSWRYSLLYIADACNLVK